MDALLSLRTKDATVGGSFVERVCLHIFLDLVNLMSYTTPKANSLANPPCLTTPIHKRMKAVVGSDVSHSLEALFHERRKAAVAS